MLNSTAMTATPLESVNGQLLGFTGNAVSAEAERYAHEETAFAASSSSQHAASSSSHLAASLGPQNYVVAIVPAPPCVSARSDCSTNVSFTSCIVVKEPSKSEMPYRHK